MSFSISEKMAELKAAMPKDTQFKRWLEQSDLWCWLYSYYRINGRLVNKGSIAAMVGGELRDNIALSDYAFAAECRDMYSDMQIYLSMDAELDARMVSRWAGILTQPSDPRQEGTLYRLNTPIVYEWEFIPPHFRELPSLADGLLRSLQPSKNSLKDPVDLACKLHLELNRLYLFGEDTSLLSFAALLYCLLQAGLPFPEVSATDTEYNKLVKDYLEGHDPGPFTDMIKRSIFNRIDKILHILEHAEQNDTEAEKDA